MLQPRQIEFVCLDQLVPANHLVRNVGAVIDFSFIHEYTEDYYSQNMTNGDIKLVISGVATKDDFLNYGYRKSLGQQGTSYQVVNAIDVGDIIDMDYKFSNLKQ